MRTEFTTAAFERSHGHRPRGSGSWAFQRSTGWTAFDRELVGEVVWVQGTLTAARKEAARLLGNPACVAVLP